MRVFPRWLAVALALSACKSPDKTDAAVDSATGTVAATAADASAPPAWTRNAGWRNCTAGGWKGGWRGTGPRYCGN